MSKKSGVIDVTLLGRQFRVSCSEEEEAGLLKAVRLVDTRMREIRNQGKVIGTERIAIMAALNIAHDLLKSGADGGFDFAALEGRITRMQNIIDQALTGQDELF